MRLRRSLAVNSAGLAAVISSVAACSGTHVPTSVPTYASVSASAACVLRGTVLSCRGYSAGEFSNVHTEAEGAFVEGEPCVIGPSGRVCLLPPDGWVQVVGPPQGALRLYTGTGLFLDHDEVTAVTSTGQRRSVVIPGVLDVVGDSSSVFFALHADGISARTFDSTVESLASNAGATRLVLTHDHLVAWSPGNDRVFFVELVYRRESSVGVVGVSTIELQLPLPAVVVRGSSRGVGVCALVENGAVYCTQPPQDLCRSTGRVVEFSRVVGLNASVSLAVGPHGACAVDHEADVRCWGANRDGRFGATNPACVDLPVSIVVP